MSMSTSISIHREHERQSHSCLQAMLATSMHTENKDPQQWHWT